MCWIYNFEYLFCMTLPFRETVMAMEGAARCIKILMFVFNFIFFVSSLCMFITKLILETE